MQEEITLESLFVRFRDWSAVTALGSLFLPIIGYLSIRFRLRALGIDPELSVLDESYLFEGGMFLIFLLSTLPILFLSLFVAGLPIVALRRIAFLRRWLDTLAAWFLDAPPIRTFLIGGFWTLLTIQLWQRKILHFEGVLFHSVPCDPQWLYTLALEGAHAPWLLAMFFTALVLAVVPTAWATRRLWFSGHQGWSALLAAMVLVQVVLIPIHYGVLVSQSSVHRLAEAPEGTEELGDGAAIWEIFSSAENAHFLVRHPGNPPPLHILEISGKDVGPLRHVDRDHLFKVLVEDRPCR